MKRLALALAIALAPVAGFAQTDVSAAPPAPDGMAPNPAMMQAMRATRAQMRQLEMQTRTQMLASLSAAHRTQIATLVGQFAVAPNPDRATLEKQIDALISRGEAQSIVNAATAERTTSRSLMESARAQFESSLTPDQLAKMKDREAKMDAMHAQFEARTPDPARELLRTIFMSGLEMRGPGGPHQ
jgi:Spy/CpxP family protein refolding chaperone